MSSLCLSTIECCQFIRMTILRMWATCDADSAQLSDDLAASFNYGSCNRSLITVKSLREALTSRPNAMDYKRLLMTLVTVPDTMYIDLEN